MGVQDDLENLRAAFGGCSLIAFADLDTQIVLLSSSEGTARRDTLDGLCRDAIASFSAAQRAGEPDADTALRCRDGIVEVYLRDPERRDDALCALCNPQTDIDGFLREARQVLTALAQEGEG